MSGTGRGQLGRRRSGPGVRQGVQTACRSIADQCPDDGGEPARYGQRNDRCRKPIRGTGCERGRPDKCCGPGHASTNRRAGLASVGRRRGHAVPRRYTAAGGVRSHSGLSGGGGPCVSDGPGAAHCATHTWRTALAGWFRGTADIGKWSTASGIVGSQTPPAESGRSSGQWCIWQSCRKPRSTTPLLGSAPVHGIFPVHGTSQVLDTAPGRHAECAPHPRAGPWSPGRGRYGTARHPVGRTTVSNIGPAPRCRAEPSTRFPAAVEQTARRKAS